MKYLTVGLLSSILLSSVAIASAVKADTIEVTPFQLVSLAQNGYLEDQGIPKGGTFIDESRAGRITPLQVVQAAVDDGRLSADTLTDQTYLNAVLEQIRGLTQDEHDR
jgi:hypothetical protein